uniref:Uncharacterized protein n=1 Tax=Tetranychus urticae TaxID=32264 RepID=T1KGX2_TETUR
MHINISSCMMNMMNNWKNICADCGGNYTDEELELSLLILMGIMCLFFIILCCQCFSRILHHCRHDDSTNYPYPEKYKSLPPPPYVRSVNGV